MARKKRYYGTLRILGILLVLVPWLGIPTSWKQIVVTVLGAVVFFLAHLSRTRPPRERSLFAEDRKHGVMDSGEAEQDVL